MMEQSYPVETSPSVTNENVGQDENRPVIKPRKRKRDDGDRTRVSRACDRCKRKKTRCSGNQPCILCTNAGESCEFTAIYRRGKIPPITTGADDIRRNSRDLSIVQHSIQFEPVNSESQAGFAHQSPHPFIAPDQHYVDASIEDETIIAASRLQAMAHPMNAPSRMQSSRNSPEPAQTDQQGHYVGPSSGASFLLRVQKKLRREVVFSQDSSIFAFGDAPLPDYDPPFLFLPPKEDAKNLVARYFDFAAPTHRFLHRPTIETWLGELYDNLGVLQRSTGAEGRMALIFMVFAQAKNYMGVDMNTIDPSARYFQAADRLLLTEKGGVRLTSVQARLCQCFYLLSQSRVNHCWSLFGTTAHLILAIGIHRKRRSDNQSNVDLIELECRKRVFWCAYTLDTYLSSSLGRPRTFHDEDIDQELPMCVNDSDIFSRYINSSPPKGQSIMLAPIAHSTLSKIISKVLRDLYSIRPPSSTVRMSLAAKYTAELKNWRSTLARFLDAEGIESSMILPLFQRQRNVLNLAYWHAQILVHRPFLLSDFASLSSRGKYNRKPSAVSLMEENVRACLEAAMNITTLVNELVESGMLYQAFWFTHYFAFSAVVVLYVYAIQQTHQPRERYEKYFNAAALCHSQMSQRANKESLAQRYSVVLDELKSETMRVTTPSTHLDSSMIGEEVNVGRLDAAQINIGAVLGRESGTAADHLSGCDTTSVTGIDNFTTWGDFDSLVTAGFGGLDFDFPGDQDDQWNIQS